MSAYLVSNTTINRVVTHLRNLDFAWIRREFMDAVHPPITDVDAALGTALFAMNVCAVEALYGQGEAKKFRRLDYTFKPEPASPRQVFESIKELQYQATEGDVPKTPLYKLLVEFRSAVADEIIEANSYQLPMEAELENSLYARCESCCKGIEHDYKACGAPEARRLLVRLGRVFEKRSA